MSKVIGKIGIDGCLYIERKRKTGKKCELMECMSVSERSCGDYCAGFGEPEIISWQIKEDAGAKLSLCAKTITFDVFTDER
jgi:hypothetical protein